MADDGNNGADRMMGYAIILITFGCIFVFIWYIYEYEIKDFIRWVRWWQMWALSFVTPDSFEISYGVYRDVAFGDLVQSADKYAANEIEGDLFGLIASGPMQVIKYPVAVVLVLCGLWCYNKGPNTNNKNKYDLDGFIGAQANNFPVISPFVDFNPSKQPFRPPGAPVPAELPLFSEALGPEEWIAYNEIPIPDGKIDQVITAKSFRKQLGRPWRGAVKLAPYQQILLAAFCLKAARKRDESDDMLGDLALSWNYKVGLKIKPELLKAARRVLKDREIAGPTLKLCNQHAYVNTAMIRALLNARNEGGVLASSQFVWLRGHDRTLWYPLNNLGKQAFHMEALGAMCHFKTEKRIMRPIPKPKIDDAVKSITDYMGSIHARPVPALDYSKSKKRGIKKVKTG